MTVNVSLQCVEMLASILTSCTSLYKLLNKLEIALWILAPQTAHLKGLMNVRHEEFKQRTLYLQLIMSMGNLNCVCGSFGN